ncbi:MAG: Xaa-Pro peptidase family protein [Hyphomicrobiaceae bacterium]
MHKNPFSDSEIEHRLSKLRDELAARDLSAAILSSPENVFYYTGLDHWGYFAPHWLVVPTSGRPVLATRAMEKVSVANMVRSADFRGHTDAQTVADTATGILNDLELAGERIGIEEWTSGLNHGLARSLMKQVDAHWHNISGLVDVMRHVKSEEEQVLMRRAAAATDAATCAAIEAIRDGAPEREVAAECLAAMTLAGGEPPGFGPFIRPNNRLGEEHTTWGEGDFTAGEPVFLEIAGCVGRYNTPNGRFVHIDHAPDEDLEMAELSKKAFDAVLAALQPGKRARDIYQAWQDVVDAAGLADYRRQHCGYVVGIAFPPSWTGGNYVAGLRHDSDVEIKTGMTFHIMSWLMNTGRGDYFLSNCVLLCENGAEVLTTSPHGPTIR